MRSFACLPAALALLSCSTNSVAPRIEIVAAWARPALTAGQTTAAYLTVQNSGGVDRLIGASSEIADRASLHSSSNEDGIARMRALTEGLEIGPSTTVSLEPGGKHLMLERVKRPLAAGEKILITLQFERSGARLVEAEIRDAAPEERAAGHEDH
jgi:periplasmic copper chaperone A